MGILVSVEVRLNGVSHIMFGTIRLMRYVETSMLLEAIIKFPSAALFVVVYCCSFIYCFFVLFVCGVVMAMADEHTHTPTLQEPTI